MAKEYHVYGPEKDFDYIIKKKVPPASGYAEYSIYRSDSSTWQKKYRGQKLMTIKETFDGFVFDKSLKKQMDYEEISHLFILMSFIHKKDPFYDGEIKKSNKTILKF